MKRQTTALLVVLMVLLAGCSRSVSVGSATPGAAYTVSVTNSTTSAMDVFFNDGTDHSLGSVAAGRTERFVVAGARQSAVTLSGRSASGRSSGPYQVQLAAGTTPQVTLR